MSVFTSNLWNAVATSSSVASLMWKKKDIICEAEVGRRRLYDAKYVCLFIPFKKHVYTDRMPLQMTVTSIMETSNDSPCNPLSYESVKKELATLPYLLWKYTVADINLMRIHVHQTSAMKCNKNNNSIYTKEMKPMTILATTTTVTTPISNATKSIS